MYEQKYDFLKGKAAIVTGAAGGIGEAICLRLAEYGINLLLVGRNEKKLLALAERLDAMGVKTICMAGDLRELDFIDKIIKTSEEQLGGIDILVNNAGLAHHCPVEEMTPEQFNSIMEINVRAPYFLCKNALPALRRSDCATIFNICSASSHRGYPEQSVYVASKHALLGFSKTLANEVYQENIRVHSISPGGVYTDMVTLVRPDLSSEGMILPKDIAAIIGFMLETRQSNAVIDEVRVNRCTKAPFS